VFMIEKQLFKQPCRRNPRASRVICLEIASKIANEFSLGGSAPRASRARCPRARTIDTLDSRRSSPLSSAWTECFERGL